MIVQLEPGIILCLPVCCSLSFEVMILIYLIIGSKVKARVGICECLNEYWNSPSTTPHQRT